MIIMLNAGFIGCALCGTDNTNTRPMGFPHDNLFLQITVLRGSFIDESALTRHLLYILLITFCMLWRKAEVRVFMKTFLIHLGLY